MGGFGKAGKIETTEAEKSAQNRNRAARDGMKKSRN
jgi:hypothetical protein